MKYLDECPSMSSLKMFAWFLSNASLYVKLTKLSSLNLRESNYALFMAKIIKPNSNLQMLKPPTSKAVSKNISGFICFIKDKKMIFYRTKSLLLHQIRQRKTVVLLWSSTWVSNLWAMVHWRAIGAICSGPQSFLTNWIFG